MSFSKLRVLLWKNYILHKRRPIGTAFQILIPVLFVILLTWGKSAFESEYFFSQPIKEEKFTLTDFDICDKPLERILYAPNTEAFNNLVKKSFENFKLKTEGFENVALMENTFRRAEEPIIQTVSISFNSTEDSNQLPKVLYYDIESLSQDFKCQLIVQNELEKGFIELTASSTPLKSKNPVVRSFPYNGPTKQIYTQIMITLLPLLFTFGMFSMILTIVKNIVEERQNRVKELMKMMGLSTKIYWLSWFITFIIMAIIIYTILTLFLCVPIIGDEAIFGYSNSFIIWLFFFVYSICFITFGFLISTFFQKASSATTVAPMLFLSTLVPFLMFYDDFEDLNHFVKWLYLLPINSAYAIGLSMALNLDVSQQGIHFSNLFSIVETFEFSFGEIMIVMLVSSVIHVLIAVYIEMVFPGEFSVPKPWHFPITNFMSKYKNSSIDNEVSDDVEDDDNSEHSDDFEEEPRHLNAKVRVVNMTKKFGSFTAVKNFNLNIYEDQITVLLGHNGGGKTTTMNVMTGLIPPTKGTAFINNFDIRTQTEEARKSLGLCPQHDVLFSNLTVCDHIIFFCRLKGMTNDKKINKEVKKYVNMMDFADKKDKLSKTLSGGQKRKLSIANALCANSQFVVLDEPTSGLDVSARRNLWDLLISEKVNRTILLTTHYMDEAEVLGDRIAIMSDGVLKTVGTSFFLKKKFGSGYRLIIVKADNCNPNQILSAVRKYAPDATIESDEQMEVVYVLSDEYVESFPGIFTFLEKNSSNLGIKSLGCSLATLEEVFLSVGENNERSESETSIQMDDRMSFEKVPFGTLMLNQTYAMFLKKFHFSRRNYIQFIITIILSMWLLFVMVRSTNQQSFEPENLDQEFSGIVQSNQQAASLAESYTTLFNGTNVEFVSRDIREYIYGSLLHRSSKYQIGVTFGSNADTIWHNNYSVRGNLLHLALNYYHRAILKNVSADYDIISLSNPYDYETYNDSWAEKNEAVKEISSYFFILLLLGFWMSPHITLKIHERAIKSKLLQFIGGVNRYIFTFVSLIIDSLMTIVIMFIIIGIIAAIGQSGFKTASDVSVNLVAITFYVVNATSMSYLIAFWFKKPSSGETIVSLFLLIFGMIYGVYAILYYAFKNVFLNFLANVIYWIGMLFGPFSLIDIYSKLQTMKLFDKGQIWSFNDNGLGVNLLMMTCGCAIFLTFVLLNDFRIFTRLMYKSKGSPKILPPILSRDEDVLAEIKRVRKKSDTKIQDSNLVMKGLSKSYGNFTAVNQLYVSVEKAECFGLLGVNGAGKTSVFKMLTGDESITSGDCWIGGVSLKDDFSKVYDQIGYCPQFDALLPELTGRETIKIFSLLRGVPLSEIDDITEAFAKELQFSRYLDRLVGNYSGGNKRKLSTCLSLLGENLSLVFLDECSSGIDARAKRQLWNAIKKARLAGRSIVISSHSMQECESLCTRLAIMVDGEFQCIGSIQHIKNKFAKGFVMKIMMSRRDDEEQFTAILNRVTRTFPMAELKENFMGLLTFHIDVPELVWSEVFAELSRMKTELGINDYTLAQSSLESVFLFFSQKGKRKVD